ncbi:MAG: type II toxin-antitoxin system PemK/MazF family toxin [Anaerolineae bacterium]|nr:type II toxin-antitoxin system PemK/MazF family toxin [Candidatus Roseilinea sp.]MDW8450428.1 type II toxin-antitoxin system PemK/MazF family toxin [Anaerolineae bacterium]
MDRFAKGDTVVVRLPFADLTGTSVRPALVIARLRTGDYVICQITSRFKRDGYSVPLDANSFTIGGLPRDSYVRPNRLFTAAPAIILGRTGTLRADVVQEVVRAVVEIVQS